MVDNYVTHIADNAKMILYSGPTTMQQKSNKLAKCNKWFSSFCWKGWTTTFRATIDGTAVIVIDAVVKIPFRVKPELDVSVLTNTFVCAFLNGIKVQFLWF